ncbi:NUDIX domain-containing protein [Colletotrichum graminicola M1.001]|uniref:NUDIX domain-containing protein n=1 Tax=Colletotrichum graminicola (strain M1.001 / M2 / FGSC 10212) TaxID=645133 RepID=E3QHV0_COLGM|nr:NUDIX domain-containing protein [Colletotrichum graminicola M1.001]EFQ30438.1 NUDIX domain-containing protein [Colletotrichum graminicola M1.001]
MMIQQGKWSTANEALPTKVIGTRDIDFQYVERSAVRVVVTDAQNNVIIIKAAKDSYYKLPGGGVEAGEDHLKAAEREVAEETGCNVLIQGACMAKTEEYRRDLHQMSYCYRAKLLDKTGKPTLTEEEVADGLSHEWVPVDKALDLMTAEQPTSELGNFIKERDIFLLTEVMRRV